MSEFWKRTLSGAVYVAVVVGCILYNELLFVGLSACLAMLAVREFNRLVHPHRHLDLFSEIGAPLMVVVTASYLHGWPFFKALTIMYLVWMVTALILELWDKDENPIANWGHQLIGQMMIALPFALMNMLNHIAVSKRSRIFFIVAPNLKLKPR